MNPEIERINKHRQRFIVQHIDLCSAIRRVGIREVARRTGIGLMTVQRATHMSTLDTLNRSFYARIIEATTRGEPEPPHLP